MLIPSMNWSDFKGRLSVGFLPYIYFQDGNSYRIYAVDGSFTYECIIPQDGGSDQTDFEANYKPSAKATLNQFDTDGASITRNKAAPAGWTFQEREIRFSIGQPNSLENYDDSNNVLSDATIKLYDSDGIITTDPAQAVKTVVDIEQAFDIYVIGGQAKIITTPTDPCRIFIIAAPDLPYSVGGSRLVVKNVDLRFITPNDRVEADGRVAKFLPYSPVYHSNKLRCVAYHAVNTNILLALILEQYLK